MQIIPLQSVPSQIVQVNLGGQRCTLAIYQKFFGLYLDLSINDRLVLAGIACQNQKRLIRSQYIGFVGDLMFIDNIGGKSDPVYTSLGNRYSLAYLPP